MDKSQLKKNRLDLEYHGESQKANAWLLLLTTGVLSFLGTFIWLEGRVFYYGCIIALIAFIIGGLFYFKCSQRMKQILEEIESI